MKYTKYLNNTLNYIKQSSINKYHSITLILMLFLSISLQAQTIDRFKYLQNCYDKSEIVCEGYFSKRHPSTMINGYIFTVVDFKVTKLYKGTVGPDSIVKIEFQGGSAYDSISGMWIESYPSHGYGLLNTSKAFYFISPKNTRGNNRIGVMVDIANPEKLMFNSFNPWDPQPYTKLDEFYSDLSKIIGKNITVKKKVNANGNTKNINKDIPYQEKYKNFQNVISTKIKLAKLNSQNKVAAATNLTLQVTNPVVSGSVFEFDVNIKADDNTTYLDNVPVWLTYNTAVFGASVVASGNVTVTNGPNFNNSSNYLPANSNMIDNASNIYAFAISSVFPGTPVRTQITTSYQLLAHVKMKIIGCGNVSTSLTNSATAINSSLYTSTPTGTALNSYNSLSYEGSLTNNITFCPPSIKDFNSPINGGMNQILTIKGTNFGTSRGNGQVKFRHADRFGFPWMDKLDNVDYISWNDTVIQIRFPSIIDTLNANQNIPSTWTPGSGNFVVKTNSGDSVISGVNLAGNTFSVYYSIYNDRPNVSGVSQNQKLKANLIKSDPTTGGYVIRLDTSVSNDPLKVMCIKKAIKDWTCLTGVNVKLGADTIIQEFPKADKICYIKMENASNIADTNIVALTTPNSYICSTQPPLRVISDFDIQINKKYLPKFFYDTTFATLPAYKIDFLEVMYHEIGHGLGLMHVIDSAAVMYYKTLGNLAISIPGGQRRRPTPYTTDVDGVNDQISSSAIIINNQCGFQDMTILPEGSCTAISVEEFLANKLNAVVYPNPSHDGKVYLTFNASDPTLFIIEIYDIVGNKIYSEALSLNTNARYTLPLNISDFANGIYILNIQSNSNKVRFKLIKN